MTGSFNSREYQERSLLGRGGSQVIEHVAGRGVDIRDRLRSHDDPSWTALGLRKGSDLIPECPGIGEDQRRVEAKDRASRQQLGVGMTGDVVEPARCGTFPSTA